MISFQWFVIALVIIAGLGYWNWNKTDQQLKQLQATGFTVSEDFKGSPRLLLDLNRQEVAVVDPKNYEIIAFSAVEKLEVIYDSGTEVDQNYRLVLYFVGDKQPSKEIAYADEWTAKKQLKKIRSFL